jgi:hypothetical protein
MRKVTIKLRSGKVVNTNCKGNLKTVGRYNNRPTKITNDMDNLIHFNHISNMFHVMMGSRPVSSRYDTFRKRSAYLDEIVNGGLIHYDNVTSVAYKTKKGEDRIRFCNEFTQGSKPFADSNRTGISVTASNGEVSAEYLTWSKLFEKSIYSDRYVEVRNILNEFGKFLEIDDIEKEYTLLDALIKMREYPDWCEKLYNIKDITPIVNFINKKTVGGFNSISHFLPNKAALLNTHAVTPKVRVDATVILYLSETDAENLLNAKAIATYLDDGYAEIDGNPATVKDLPYIDECDIDDDIDILIDNYNYVKISTLPTTKVLKNEN